MATYTETQLVNDTLLSQLETKGMEKVAIDAINDFTRMRMREDGVVRRYLPPLQISNDELDRQYDMDDPAKIIDKEPDSPAAISVPFGALPINFYIRGSRYRVLFSRILSPRFTKDVDQLRTYVMDIRQVMSDNALKDMLAEEDNKGLGAVNTALIAADSVTPFSGVAQWQTISGGITRDTLQDAFKIMPSTPSHLEVQTVLVNNITIREVLKWGRDEVGGDFAQDLLKNGWSEQKFMDANWIITIKRDLVPDSTAFMFADPKFMGKFLILEDTTMYIERKFYFLEFFGYESIGLSYANTSAFARADFVG